MIPHEIWREQCHAAREIRDEFGSDKALEYLVGEKFINFLSAAETEKAFRDEIPGFVAAVQDIFDRSELAAYLEVARQTEPFDPADYDDPEETEVARKLELRQSANELLLVERAREWLLDE
jgi:hypothetical protein